MADFTHRPLQLDAYFDKVFYINLAHDVQRNEQMISLFQQFRITNYERVDAIRLTELPSGELYRNFIKSEPKYILGSLSCKASHIKCIKIAKERGYSKILVLEDDVTFLQNPHWLLTANSAILNDWDMLYFGGLVEPYFRNQIVGTYAYAIRNTLFDNVIYMAEASGMEIDNFYAKILQHMSYNHNQSGKYNIRVAFPFNSIAHNAVSQSNIQSGNAELDSFPTQYTI